MGDSLFLNAFHPFKLKLAANTQPTLVVLMLVRRFLPSSIPTSFALRSMHGQFSIVELHSYARTVFSNTVNVELQGFACMSIML